MENGYLWANRREVLEVGIFRRAGGRADPGPSPLCSTNKIPRRIVNSNTTGQNRSDRVKMAMRNGHNMLIPRAANKKTEELNTAAKLSAPPTMPMHHLPALE